MFFPFSETALDARSCLLNLASKVCEVEPILGNSRVAGSSPFVDDSVQKFLGTR